MGQRNYCNSGNWKFTRSILRGPAVIDLEQGEDLALLQEQGGGYS